MSHDLTSRGHVAPIRYFENAGRLTLFQRTTNIKWLMEIKWSRDRWRDHSIPHGAFPIGGPLKRSLYPQAIRDWALSVLGSGLHLSGSRDVFIHATTCFPISPIGDPLKQSLYLVPFSRYWALGILGSRVWPFVVTWRHRPFPIDGPWKPRLSLTVSGIQWRMCRNGSRDLKWPLNKGQGHSFWCQSISHVWLAIGCQ